MYKILGGDQKEYGPVTAEQVREWIAQRRANAQTLIQAEGARDWQPLSAFPEFASALTAPLAYAPVAATGASSDSPISAVIPYKNPKALIAYYLAIFSLIPCLGIPLGIAALVLGILGLKAAKAHPQAHGQVHAWVGIILGSLCAASNIVALVVVLVSASGPGAGLVWWSLGENHESLKAAANTQLRTVLRMSLVSHGKIKS